MGLLSAAFKRDGQVDPHSVRQIRVADLGEKLKQLGAAGEILIAEIAKFFDDESLRISLVYDRVFTL